MLIKDAEICGKGVAMVLVSFGEDGVKCCKLPDGSFAIDFAITKPETEDAPQEG